MKLRPSLSLLLVWTTLLTLLPPGSARTVMGQDLDKTVDDSYGFRLSEGKEIAEATPSGPTAGATALSEVETRRLLARLPTLKPQGSDTLNFKLRERSLPPPRAGATIQAAFAPARVVGLPAGVITPAPLEVTRFAPEGEVELAPNLSVTFSQPMVAVSSQEEAAANVPVTLTPQPRGKWRWLGTQTVMFQPDAEGGRLPMATSYVVTIPAGAKSALGNVLPETRTFTFANQPQSDLIPKLVRGLLSGRKSGRWLNTQENVFILLALDRYFNAYERTTPDFVARVWLGNGYAGEQIFKGRSIDRQQLNLPMSELIERTSQAPANLTIAKEGAGRLYFRIGARYAPANLKIAAADYGFQVERQYEAIDNPADVQREADGGWLIKAGARVRVRVTMSNPARRYHVALVDSLPAGLEPLNPELATTERLPPESGEEVGGRAVYDDYRYWRGTWYEHQNLRDERVEAFTSLLWEGVHEYTYFARATTPGLFVVPPPKAEETYAPETFGRGHTDRVRVR